MKGFCFIILWVIEHIVIYAYGIIQFEVERQAAEKLEALCCTDDVIEILHCNWTIKSLKIQCKH